MLAIRTLFHQNSIVFLRSASSLRLTKQVSQQLSFIKECTDSLSIQRNLLGLLNIVQDPDIVVQSLNKLPGCIEIGMKMKEELTQLTKATRSKKDDALALDTGNIASLISLDAAMKTWITNVFCYDTIELKTVTFESASGSVLEKVSEQNILFAYLKSTK